MYISIAYVDIHVFSTYTQLMNNTYNISPQNGKDSSCAIIINIIDVNDNLPEFEKLAYNGTLPEDAPLNSFLKTLPGDDPIVIEALDKDSGRNAVLVYSIVEEYAKNFFGIDPYTG